MVGFFWFRVLELRSEGQSLSLTRLLGCVQSWFRGLGFRAVSMCHDLLVQISKVLQERPSAGTPGPCLKVHGSI